MWNRLKIVSRKRFQNLPVPSSALFDELMRSPENLKLDYIGETNKSLKERVSDHRNQTTSAIRNHHISTKHPKAELKKILQ